MTRWERLELFHRTSGLFFLLCAISLSFLKPIAFAQDDATAKLEIGNPAPSFSASGLNGERIELQEQAKTARLVLLDFWASWCGPCRKEFPTFSRMYRAYKDKGLVIIGVSLDQDKDKAIQAAQQNGLDYPHVFDGNGWKNSVAQLYNIQSIPSTYLLWPDLTIEARGLRGVSLEETISELLGVSGGDPGDPEGSMKSTGERGDSIKVSSFSPSLPAKLKTGDRLLVRVQYELKSCSGCRIWIRPLTRGRATPGYEAHRSQVYSRGSGEMEGWFLIKGNPSKVDQIRIQMAGKRGTLANLVCNIEAEWQ